MAHINLTRFKQLIAIAIFATVLYIAIDKRYWWLDLYQLSVEGFVLLSVVTLSLWLVGSFILRLLYRSLDVFLTFSESAFLAVATSLGNYLPFVQGGTVFKSLYLKEKHELGYSQFIASLGSMYLVNVLTCSAIGFIALGWFFFVEDTFHLEVTLCLFSFLAVSSVLCLVTVLPPCRQFLSTTRLEWLFKFTLVLQMRKHIFWGLVLTYAVAIIFQATQLYLAYVSLGYRISIVYCFIVIPFTIFVSLIGITPGGLGLTEVVVAFTSNALGYGLQQGAVAATLIRVISLLWMLPLGGTSMYLLSRKES